MAALETGHCPSALCRLAFLYITDASLSGRTCAARRALEVGVGRRIAVDADVTCIECGVERRCRPSAEVWLRDWTGEPTCWPCLDLLELSGELLAFGQDYEYFAVAGMCDIAWFSPGKSQERQPRCE